MAYTHCQPAQPTTVGKRATLWANELVMDLAEIDHRLATLQLRGVKGTTGTQASFMELFKGCLLYTSGPLGLPDTARFHREHQP